MFGFASEISFTVGLRTPTPEDKSLQHPGMVVTMPTPGPLLTPTVQRFEQILSGSSGHGMPEDTKASVVSLYRFLAV